MKRLSDFYTVEAAAIATGIRYKTLLKRISRGTLKAEEIGRMKLIPTSEVERLKKEHAE